MFHSNGDEARSIPGHNEYFRENPSGPDMGKPERSLSNRFHFPRGKPSGMDMTGKCGEFAQ
jgi:hypothetical protein